MQMPVMQCWADVSDVVIGRVVNDADVNDVVMGSELNDADVSV